MLKRFIALFSARNKEFYRDTAAMGWNFMFPILVVFGFAFAFSGNQQDLFKVAVHSRAGQADLSKHEFTRTPHIQFVPVEELKPAIEKTQRHQFDMVVSL